jgi:plasmid stabilization system protein ParE
MKSILSPRALRELNRIHDYIAQYEPSAAQSFVDRVYSLMDTLEAQPLIGRATNTQRVLGLPLVDYPYLVFYRLNLRRSEIEIVSIRHAARRHPGFREAPAEIFAR